MTPFQHHLLALGLIALTSGGLGAFLLWKNPNQTTNRTFALYTFSLTWWSVWELLTLFSPNEAAAVARLRIEYLGVCLIPTLFFHGVAILTGSRRKRELPAYYALSAGFILLISGLRHPALLPDARPIAHLPYWGHAASLFFLFVSFFSIAVFRAHSLLWRAAQNETAEPKKTALYALLFSSALAYVAAIPEFSLKFGIQIPFLHPYGLYSVPLYVVLVTYAIIQFKLFDIQVVMRRSVLYSLILALLAASYFGLVYTTQQLFRMNLLQHHILALLLTAATTLGLGLLVFLSDTKRRLNQIFGLYSLSIAWWSFWEALVVGAPSEEAARIFAYLEWPGVIFIAPTFAHSVFLFAGTTNRWVKGTLRIAYTLSFGFLAAHLGLNAMIDQPRQVAYTRFFSALSSPGLLLPLTFFALVNVGLWKLWREYRRATGQRRIQLNYLFWGSLIGYLGGSPDWLLVFGRHVPYLNPFGIYGVPLYSLATAYAVLQHRLFDVNLVVRKSLVYSLVITLLTVGYFGLVYGVERLFQLTLGYQSAWLSLSAFALMALLFQPLKIGIQRFVDWLFFRTRHEELVKRLERLEQETRQTEKLRSVATLATGLCHELRNPLQAVQTYAEYLPERYREPDFREKCREIMRTEITRVNNLLKQLMDFAKPKRPSFQEVDPHTILDSTLAILSHEFVKRQIDLEKRYRANGARIQADPDQIRQVILNLVLNAVQAVGKDGRVTVRTARHDGQFILQVSDTGPGIDPKILPKLFEPFNTSKPDGNGLGLSVIHSIVREHRGRIGVESAEGKGAAFTVKLPLG